MGAATAGNDKVVGEGGGSGTCGIASHVALSRVTPKSWSPTLFFE